MYDENLFNERLAKLRTSKGVSARNMSLSIGQSANYINKIENKKAFPKMQNFFYICEYLGITPKEFFDDEIKFPAIYSELFGNLKELDEEQITNINNIVKGLLKK
ncbi:MAG: helix-turn-helix domain-containing protein [Oscillospiraceae bacterium]|nr:helix-turn-helix domain-containing protein [Oscillospiraceae bacterium]